MRARKNDWDSWRNRRNTISPLGPALQAELGNLRHPVAERRHVNYVPGLRHVKARHGTAGKEWARSTSPLGTTPPFPLSRWQCKHKHTAMVQFAFGTDRPTMGPHDVLGNRQPQPRPPRFTGSRFVHPVETFEQSGQV